MKDIITCRIRNFPYWGLLLFFFLNVNSISAQELIPFRDGFKMGYCDKDKKLVIECKYKVAFPFIGERAVVLENESFCLIDKKGEKVHPGYFYIGPSITNVPKRIKNVYLFSSGSNTYSIIDTNGKYILEKFKGSISEFQDGLSSYTTSTHDNWNSYRYGIMNDSGRILIPEKYKRIQNYSEGLIPVQNSLDKWGFVDKNDNTVIPFIYEWAFSFSEGLACVKKNGKFGFIDKKGKEIIPCRYDKGYTPFSEGLTTVDSGKFTLLINKKGRTIKVMDKVFVGKFICGRAKVNKFTTANYYGFIDRNGNEVVPVIYPQARDFTKSGLAALQMKDGKYFLWGFVDTNGKAVTPFEYFDVGLSQLNNEYYFDNGLCLVNLSVTGSGSEFFIDTKNNRHSAQIIKTTDKGYITATRYKELLEEEKQRYEAWKRSQPTRCLERCPDCQGTGASYSKPSNYPCGVCGGSGVNGYSKSTMDSYTKRYTSYSPNTCWKCNGTGSGGSSSHIERCGKCYGAGCLRYGK